MKSYTIKKDHAGNYYIARVDDYRLERYPIDKLIEAGSLIFKVVKECNYARLEIGNTKVYLHTDKHGHKILQIE